MIADQIRRIAENENVSVFGIGAASKMADEQPGHRPNDLLPGAQSLICFGIPGALQYLPACQLTG